MKLFFLPRAIKLPLILIISLFSQVNPAFSQASNIVPDNTLGDESSQVIENADGGLNEVITGGAVREQNLFHSFQEFNISEGRGAFFTNPEAVSNIFSRVTGGNPSNILGVLGVNGAANLYLINPNGIIFGENSSLNVQGSFTATTSNGIRFGEQGEFNTINPQTPESLTIDPSAYLFNQIADGDINSIQSQGSLQVPQGENIVLLGGDINLKGVKGYLLTLGGTVELGSVNDTGEIGISEESSLIFSDEVARGNISLLEASAIFAFVPGKGSINVYSQNLTLTENSRMGAGISQGLDDSDTVSGNIVIDVLGIVSLNGGSILSNIAENAEDTTGKIEVFAESVILQNGGTISAVNSATGNVGDIEINAAESVIIDGERSINGGTASQISSNVFSNAEGNGGNLEINTNSLRVTNGGLITSDIEGKGEGGNITITATDLVLVDGERSNGESSRISSIIFPEAQGKAGELEINTNSLELINGGLILSDTFGRGEGGDVAITATDLVLVDGERGNGESSRISSLVGEGAEGDAGNIAINTNSLKLINGGRISTATGEIGDAGEISIDADTVLLGEDSTITTRSITEGNAGNIELKDFNTLLLENASITSNSSKSTGGGITLVGGDISLRGDSNIVTNVENGAGGGGDITITANSVVAFDDSDIFAFARGGEGGSVNLDTPAFFGENFTSNSLTGNPDLLDNNSRADINATGAVLGTVSLPDVSFIQNSLSELPDNSLNTDELVANSCVVPVGNREQGQFVITGGESLPVRPGDSKPSKYPTGEVRNLPDNSNWQSGDRIIEPQGAYRLANGKLVLSRECQ